MANSTVQEWLDRNAYRRFPLEEDSDMSCVDAGAEPDCRGRIPRNGSILPDSLILDARFCLFGTSEGRVLLVSARIESDGSASAVVDLPGRGRVEIGPSGLWSDDEFSVRLTFGRAERLAEAAGEYRLFRPAGFLRSRVLSIPYGIGVDSLTCGNVTAAGSVRVVDGRNSSLDIYRNNLVLSVGRGLGLGVSCTDGTHDSACDGKVLYYLNGQKADSDGNISVIGGEGVSVSTGTYKGIPAVIVLTSPAVNNFAYR